MFSLSYKPGRQFGLLLLIILLSGLLVSCSEDNNIIEPSTSNASYKTARPASTSRPDETAVPALPTPTPVMMEPTVTPLGSPAPLPTFESALPVPTVQATPTTSPDPAQGGVASSFGLSDIPRSNGLPKLPGLDTVVETSPAVKPTLKANYGSKGQPKVGIQAGHWQSEALPEEFASLRGQTGGQGGGVREVDVMLDLSRRVVKLLQDKGIEADLLPATVPIGYTADAFVAIHADAVDQSGPNGYKLARSRFTAIPYTDDALLNSIYSTYGRATSLGRSDSITRNMTGYFAFNNRRRSHAVSKTTPAVILETGYLTNPADRAYMLSHPDQMAQGIVEGIVNFLEARPPLENREKAAQTVPGIEVISDKADVLDERGGKPIAQVAKGQQFEARQAEGDYYLVWVPGLNKSGYLRQADVKAVILPR